MNRKTGNKIEKWDEVNGVVNTETLPDTADPTEMSGAGPSISKNFMRGIEDMVEQNDNNFDGVINNVSTDIPDGIKAAKEQEEASILEALKKTNTAQEEVKAPRNICPPELCL